MLLLFLQSNSMTIIGGEIDATAAQTACQRTITRLFNISIDPIMSALDLFVQFHLFRCWNGRIKCHLWTIKQFEQFQCRPEKRENKKNYTKMPRSRESRTIFQILDSNCLHPMPVRRPQCVQPSFARSDDSFVSAPSIHTRPYNWHYNTRDHLIRDRIVPIRSLRPCPKWGLTRTLAALRF